jgi:hypothetical protein
MTLQPSVSHDRAQESPTAKAKWFQSLSIEERMEYLCEVTDLALDRHPEIAGKRHAPAFARCVLVLSRA